MRGGAGKDVNSGEKKELIEQIQKQADLWLREHSIQHEADFIMGVNVAISAIEDHDS